MPPVARAATRNFHPLGIPSCIAFSAAAAAGNFHRSLILFQDWFKLLDASHPVVGRPDFPALDGLAVDGYVAGHHHGIAADL